MKIIVTIILLLFIFFNRCASQSPKVIRIDPESAIGGSISDVFKQVKYIPLETNKESLFGKIDQLVVSDHYFFILDNESNSILIFDNNGKFHAKINGGSNLSNGIVSFAIDKDKKTLKFLRLVRPDLYMAYYNFDGKLLKQIKHHSLSSWRFFQLPNDRTGYYDYSVSNKLKDSVVNEISIFDANDKFQEGFFPYNQKTTQLKSNEIMTSAFFPFYKKSTNDSSLFYVRPYDYHIYTVSSSRLDTSFRFIFPLAYSLPADYRTNHIYDGKRLKYFMDFKNMIFNISYTYKLEHNLFFSLDTWGGLSKADYYLYNLNSDSLICLNKVSPDSSNSFLPIANQIYAMGRYFAYSDGVSLYSSVSSLQMFAAFEGTKDKNAIYPPVLQNYFATQSHKSNPVIVLLKPKEHL